MKSNIKVKSKKKDKYLSEQIITYLGNKRSLLDFIGSALDIVKSKLNKDKLDIVDMFSGSGIVSRYFKEHANKLIANDLEDYCYTLNKCYLENKNNVDFNELQNNIDIINNKINQNGYREGFIAKLYAPKDDQNIKLKERVFYTTRNAKFLDTARQLITEIVPKDKQHLLIAPLITEASIKTNTPGVFKGFYKNNLTGIGQYGGNGKNALKRIMGDIELQLPILSESDCKVELYKEEANVLAQKLEHVDLVYLDPPYNQHPYGSNYFMLNLINSYQEPTKISKISGIAQGWNKSDFNNIKTSFKAMKDLCTNLETDFLLISFNSEGFISSQQMLDMLKEIGKVEILETKYNAFKGSRNLNKRSTHVKEYLYLVDKRK